MHVLQATSVQITHLASQGGPIGNAERGAYAISERLSQTIQHPDAEAYFAVCRGLSLFHRGRWKEASEVLFSRTAQRSNAAFSHARIFGVYSLFYLGRLREHARRAAHLLADSERRGDLYTAVNLYAAQSSTIVSPRTTPTPRADTFEGCSRPGPRTAFTSSTGR